MRLLIVSNRLPITAEVRDGQVSFERSVGGVATGLSAYLSSLNLQTTPKEYVWIGWPGSTVEDQFKEQLKAKALAEQRAYPVFLSQEEMENFYLGFCNKTIWALFHYFTSYAVYDQEYWSHYVHVNEAFCRVVQEIAQPNDLIWVHDYQLMLLPGLIRKRMSNVSIGFFLHIPFPSFEVFRLLPGKWRSEILQGLLGADVIGFHTYDYVQSFLRCVLRIAGLDHSAGEIMINDRVVKVDTFPMGVDYQKFHTATSTPEVCEERTILRKTLGNSRVILSIDRLDYSKGILHRLLGYEMFLERYPEWQGKVTLLLIVVPSRVEVDQYQHMKREIDEAVGRIGGKFTGIEWTPILYQYKSFSFNSLVALYNESDAILVTPLRDGMNLVAKEYVAARSSQTGVLILSEMAGAANELGEAIIISPNNIEEIAEALHQGLQQKREEQIERIRVMQARLKRYNVVRWADDFIKSLLALKEAHKTRSARVINHKLEQVLMHDFRRAQQRLIFLDYDGTLVNYSNSPSLAKPDRALLNTLERLSNRTQTQIVIISGRDRATLADWFGTLNVALIAEHGVWFKACHEDWKTLKPLSNEWKTQIHPILEVFADRLPGAFVEEKEYSLAFHYRRADQDLAWLRVRELTDNLVHLTANIDLQVMQGRKVVEVRNAGINKGGTALHFIENNTPEFILAIGDDATDEDLFRALPSNAYSIKVGIGPSHAKYNVYSYLDVQKLLAGFIHQFE